MMKFEGKNAVFELLNSKLTIEKIMVQDKVSDLKIREIVSLAKDKGIRIDWVNKLVLDKNSETGHHQGVIGFATEFQYSDVLELINKSEPGNRIFLMLDGVLDPHNVGSVLRIADCFNLTGVILPKNRSATVNETVIRVSAGASAYVPVAKVTNLVATIKELKEKGFWVYAADMDGEVLSQVNLTGDVCFVIGAEGDGVSKLVKQESDGVVRIPMSGHVNSLNASVSAGIVCYEAIRQRANK